MARTDPGPMSPSKNCFDTRSSAGAQRLDEAPLRILDSIGFAEGLRQLVNVQSTMNSFAPTGVDERCGSASSAT